MTFRQVLSFFLTGATVLSMSATALAADTASDAAEDTGANTVVDGLETALPADVADTAWYAPAVHYVLEEGLMDLAAPVDAGFWPLHAVSRQAVADALYRDAKNRDEKLTAGAAGMGIREMADYADIGQDYYLAMTFCFDAGILTGDDEKRLRPGKTVSREEFAAMLTRYLGLLEENGLTETVPGDGMAVQEFTDASQISDWAADSVAFCLKNGLMNGNTDGSFAPQGNVLRAELAQVLRNIASDAGR